MTVFTEQKRNTCYSAQLCAITNISTIVHAMLLAHSFSARNILLIRLYKKYIGYLAFLFTFVQITNYIKNTII